MTTGINDTIRMDKLRIVRSILYMKLTEKGLSISENDLSLFCLFSETEDKDEVIERAMQLGYVKSWQTGENVISRLVTMNMLHKKDKKKRNFPKDIFPNESLPQVAAKIVLHNLNYATPEV